MNIALIAGAYLAAPEDALFILSWAFFAGSVLMALTGVLITRRIFKEAASPAAASADLHPWREVYASTASNGLTGIALAGLQWGPACVLAIFGTDVGIAQYAVVYRTAQIIDFLVPAVILIPQAVRFQSHLCEAMSTLRGKLAVDLAVSFSTTTAWVIAVAIITPWLTGIYGPPYTEVAALFLLLYATQWILGGARPAMRQLAAEWDLGRIRRVLLISVAAAVLITLVGVSRYGAVAAAVGVLTGALVEHAQALGLALRQPGTARPSSPS
jgi:O-antigen/teichoic acid export membrane protein